MNRKYWKVVLLGVLFPVFSVVAQSSRKIVEVRVKPSSGSWVYRIGEDIQFSLSVVQNEMELKNVVLTCKIGPELMTPTSVNTLIYMGTPIIVSAGKAKIPGFVTCEVEAIVEGKPYSGVANVGVAVDQIKPTATMPADFRAFWDEEVRKARQVVLESLMTLMPERCTPKSEVYHVSFHAHRQGARMYGILSVPRAKGKYPAILNVPGAGVRPYAGDVYLTDNDSFISLTIGIHAVPVNMEQSVYDRLFDGILHRYWEQNLDDRQSYYYNRVYLGCVRAVDFIFSLSEFDGTNIAVCGGSQGGALAIVTAALDSRIKCLSSFYPALSDLSGFAFGRAGGWPMMFRYQKQMEDPVVQRKLETSAYYDVVNFARILAVPGFYSWGYNDAICCPTSVYSVYNSVAASKQSYICPETGHWNYPEQWEERQRFIKRQFGINQ